MAQKTIKELITEMNHRHVSIEEINAARDYEKSLIPKDIVIPKTGEVYRSIREINITTMTTFAAPFTGGEECILPAGVDIKVDEIYEDLPLSITCVPLKYKELEALLVPSHDRNIEKYTGYYLSISTIEFKDGFTKIQS